jgi:hypothetical protein
MRNTKKVQIQKQLKAAAVYEPSYDKDVAITTSEVVKVLNWYHGNRTAEDAAKYLKCDLATAKRNLTLAWVSRMVYRGYILPEKESQTFHRMKEEFASATKKPVAVDQNVEKVSVQDRITAKADEIIAELEGLVDEFGITGSAKKMNAYKWYSDNDVKSAYISRIVDHFQKSLDELLVAKSGKDTELSEGYSELKRGRLQNMINCIQSIIDDAQKIGQNQKVARKPRAKKPVTVDKLISKLKFKEKDDDFQIQSVNPIKIIGAHQLWVFNTKTRKLGRYIANDTDGFSIKGTTLINFSEQSKEKIVRKPEDILPKVLKATKPAMNKILEGIRSKEYDLTGRINSDVIILKVV